ncbi:MAG: hypothetical protein WEB88_03060 [Gemmatimonadota bacterium]
MLGIITVIAAGAGGYAATRKFVTNRLRYVDDIKHPAAPLVAAGVATAAALPLAILPIITVGTVMVFGGAVGIGTFAGVQTLRKEDAGWS